MNRKMATSVLVVALLFASACKKKPDEKEAIRQGVVRHLASMQGLNLPNMEINVSQYSVNGNQATAQVQISAKGAEGAGGMMQLAYSLEKTSGEWVVVKSTPAGGSLQHPAPGEAPPGGAMPPGHPGVSGNPGAVHPDFNEILNGGKAPAQQPPAQQPPAAAPIPPPTKP